MHRTVEVLAVIGFLAGVLLALLAPALGSWLLVGLLAPLGYLAGVVTIGLAVGRRQPWRVRWRVPVAMGLMHFAWGIGFLVRSR